MNKITDFLNGGVGMSEPIVFDILQILIFFASPLILMISLIVYLVIPFILANRFSRRYRDRLKYRILSFIAALLVIILTMIVIWRIFCEWLRGEICFISTFNVFLFLLWKSKKWYAILIKILILNLLLFPSIEVSHRWGSLMNCEGEEMQDFKVMIDKYVKAHNGSYPISEGKLFFRDDLNYYITGGKSITCGDSPYKWTRKQYKVGDDPNLMLVWDGKPHGFIFKWRNVIVIGTHEHDRLRRIPEGEFQKLLREQQESVKSK